MTQASASGDAFNDSLNFVKKLWGQMGVPGMPGGAAMPGMSIPGMPNMPLPSMSLEDLDKRIQELKTVETWLNVNMTMLRNTIQALEVQRATIATLHSLSTTMANTMQGLNPGESSGGYSFTSSPASEEKPASVPADENTKPAAKTKTRSSASEADAEVSPLVTQSAVWWQSVQDQFKQALGTALEKSTANYETVKASSENIVKATAANLKTSAAGTRVAAKTTAKAAPKAAPARRTAAKSATKPAGKAKPKS